METTPPPAPEPVVVSPEDAATAEAQETGSQIVVDELTTPTELVKALPDGTLEKTVNSEPVRMQHEGLWKDISTNLTLVGTGESAAIVPEMLPVELRIGAGGSNHMATVSDGKGHRITESWPFGELPAPVIDGNTATYPEVLPGVDLVQIARSHGISQVLKIKTEKAASDSRVAQMRVHLDASGIDVTEDNRGGMTAKSLADGTEVFRAAQGQWWDSSHPDATALDPGGPGITRPFDLSLAVEKGQEKELFDMGAIFSAPGTTYPIYVDPEWSASRLSYLYVDSSFPNTSYWNGQYSDGVPQVGFLPAKWNPDGVNKVARSFWQFNSSPVNGRKILKAVFNATETWSASCTPRPVSAWVTYGVTSTTTWNTQPGFLKLLSTQNVAKGYSSSCTAGTVGFDMAPAKDWLAYEPQWTVALRADNEGDELGWKRFANNASIIITYGTPPNTPKVTAMTGCAFTCTGSASAPVTYTRLGQPIFTAFASDPDGNADGTIYVEFTLRNSARALIASSIWSNQLVPGTGGSTTWQVPAERAPLWDEDGYVLTVQAFDSKGLSSGTSSFTFSVDKSPPPPPTVDFASPMPSDLVDPAGVVGGTAYTATITSTKPVWNAGFVYAVTEGPAAATYPTNVSCANPRNGSYIVVCPADGKTATATIAAIDTQTTLTVWTFDAAGNVNAQLHGAPTAKSFTVGQLAHTPDTVLPVDLVGAAQWVDVESFAGTPVSSSCTGSSGTGGSETIKALQVLNTGDHAKSQYAAVNTAQSFSMSGWFCPVSQAAGPVRIGLSQLSDVQSLGGVLQIGTTGVWQFGTPTTATPPVLETVSDGTVAAGNSWYYLNATFDKINQQLRLSVTKDLVVTTWVVATTSANHPASTGTSPAVLGSGNPASTSPSPFIGQIASPVIAAGVLTRQQFQDAGLAFSPTTTGILK
jgi:hypothetical protein